MELAIREFILANEDWEYILRRPPFNLRIGRKDGYIMFKYNMHESDKTNPIVVESRGIIFEEATWTPVCVPFFRFYNYGESSQDKIDWTSARVLEKVDGSMVKVWFHNGWHVSSNGLIDAAEANTDGGKTIRELFELAIKGYAWAFWASLDKRNTYMFEITSPFNTIVIPYLETELTHLGTRNMETLEEIEVKLPHVKYPKSYALNSIEGVVNSTKEMDENEEGYVVVDANYKRIKVKSPAYVALHHVITNNVTKRDAYRLVLAGEEDEVMATYPQSIPILIETREEFETHLREMEKVRAEAIALSHYSQKDFALLVKDSPVRMWLFKFRLDPEYDLVDYYGRNHINTLITNVERTNKLGGN